MIEERRFRESTDWIRANFCEADPRGIMLGWQIAIEHLTRHIDLLQSQVHSLQVAAPRGIPRPPETCPHDCANNSDGAGHLIVVEGCPVHDPDSTEARKGT